jgi:ankyrin repeat protein
MRTCGTGAVLLAALFLLASSAAAQSIHEAAGEGDEAVVRALLSQDRSLLDSRDDEDCTPLHYAAAGGHTDLFALLADAGPQDRPRIRALTKRLH